jgi:transposase-like protein
MSIEPAYNGRLPEIKAQIIDMMLNGSGIRDTARVLKISPTTVINELKNGSVGERAICVERNSREVP